MADEKTPSPSTCQIHSACSILWWFACRQTRQQTQYPSTVFQWFHLHPPNLKALGFTWLRDNGYLLSTWRNHDHTIKQETQVYHCCINATSSENGKGFEKNTRYISATIQNIKQVSMKEQGGPTKEMTHLSSNYCITCLDQFFSIWSLLILQVVIYININHSLVSEYWKNIFYPSIKYIQNAQKYKTLIMVIMTFKF